ncbi:MAG: hypothetical protein ACLPVW_06500 [Terriglobales bacterium]|jgi:hypothetical protein
MKKWFCLVAGLSLALAGSPAAHAQTPVVPPPNILNIETVNIKPYADGPYDKVASEYPGLSEQLKDPTHVLAMEALTGSPRAIYLAGYDSYEALQKNEEWLLGDPKADAKFDALDAREAAYVSEVHYTIWHFRPDLSNNVAGADIPHSHYWEVIVFHMRPGHVEQFEELTKLYRDASLKSGQNVPWATYQGLMGVTDSYLVLVPMTSLKDVDTGLAHRKDFGAALGNEGGQRMGKLTEESVASVEDNLWMVNPEWSYVEKSWIEADPQYWAPEPAAKHARKPAAGAAPKAPN